MKITQAAELIQKAYDRDLSAELAHPPLNKKGVEAWMLRDGTLVVPGTNDTADWWRNINVGRSGRGASRRTWHKGFLEHARVIYDYATPLQPKLVIGHSLGAAAAQILGVSWKIPAICFASPRPLRGRQRFPGEGNILNINRWDDIVTQLPPIVWFRHVGRVHRISPGETQSEGSHSIPDYLRAMSQGRVRPPLPDSWG
jgi:pimeloyl-ACP methyl ester carboxylesterase